MANDIRNCLAKLTPIRTGMPLLDVVTAERIQAIQDALVALAGGANVMSGANVRLNKGPGYVMISANAVIPPPSSSEFDMIRPFYVTQAPDPTGGKDYYVRIYAGMINEHLPKGMYEGDDPPLVMKIKSPSKGRIWVKIRLTDGDVLDGNEITLDNEDELPEDDAIEKIYHHTIAFYQVKNDALLISNMLAGSQSFELCGGEEPVWGVV